MAKHPVFLVDDNEQYLKTMEKHLHDHRDFNYIITLYNSGEECLKNLDKKPEVIVLDYYFDSVNENAINGIETLKKIKEEDPDINVVMLSGQESIDVALETMKYGAFDYVVKNESAHVRTRNSINNIIRKVKAKTLLKVYKTATIFLSVALGLLIIMTIIMKIWFPQLVWD